MFELIHKEKGENPSVNGNELHTKIQAVLSSEKDIESTLELLQIESHSKIAKIVTHLLRYRTLDVVFLALGGPPSHNVQRVGVGELPDLGIPVSS